MMQMHLSKSREREGADAVRGFTLLEVLVGLSILTVGMLTIFTLIPPLLKANTDAELESIAGSLAMLKVEEIRRDSRQLLRDDPNTSTLVEVILALDAPTSVAIFSYERRLAYRFEREVILDENTMTTQAVAVVVVQESPQRSSNPRDLNRTRFQ